MIAEIINASEYHTQTGRQCIRLKVICEETIYFLYTAPEAYLTFCRLFHWCHVPIVRSRYYDKVSLNKLKGKYIPVKFIKYRERDCLMLNFPFKR